MHLPNWQLVPDVRAKHLIPVSLMLVPIEKGMESAEAFKLLKEYLLKIKPDLWHELSCGEASGITPVLPARGKKAAHGKVFHSRNSVEIKRQESGTKSPTGTRTPMAYGHRQMEPAHASSFSVRLLFQPLTTRWKQEITGTGMTGTPTPDSIIMELSSLSPGLFSFDLNSSVRASLRRSPQWDGG